MGPRKTHRNPIANQFFSNEPRQNISAISRMTLSEISMQAFVEKTKKGGPEMSESPVSSFRYEKIDVSYRESIQKRSASPVGSR